MKQKILIPIMLFVLMIGTASAEIIYQEDFEDGIADDWSLPSFMTINDVTPIAGSYDLLIGQYESGSPDIATYTFSELQKNQMINNIFEIKYEVKIENDTEVGTLFTLRNNQANSIIACGVGIYGILYCYNPYTGVEESLINTTNGTTYELKYLFNDKERTYQIFFDGELVTSSEYGETSIYPIDGISITHITNSNPQEHIDEITIDVTPIIPAIQYREGSDLTGAVIDNGTKIIVGLGRIALLVGIIIAGILAFAFVKFIIKK